MKTYKIEIGQSRYFSAAYGYDRQPGVEKDRATVVTEGKVELTLSRLQSYGIWGTAILNEVEIQPGQAPDEAVELNKDNTQMAAVQQGQEPTVGVDANDDVEVDVPPGANANVEVEDEENSISKKELELKQLATPMGMNPKPVKEASLPSKPSVDPTTPATTEPSIKVDDIKVDQPTIDNDADELSVVNAKVPPAIINKIKSEIKRLYDEGKSADDTPMGGGIKTELTAAQALEDVLQFLQHGDEGFKQAQVLVSSLMSPLQSAIDQEIVQLFLSGRTSRSLKDIYNNTIKNKNKE